MFFFMFLDKILNQFTKNAKTGPKVDPSGPRKGHFWSFFKFLQLNNSSGERLSFFLNFPTLCFWAYLKVICKKSQSRFIN